MCLLSADVVDCGKTPIISNGSFVYTNTTFGSRANIQCHEGYSINENTSYICVTTGLWSGSAKCGKICSDSFDGRCTLY